MDLARVGHRLRMDLEGWPNWKSMAAKPAFNRRIGTRNGPAQL